MIHSLFVMNASGDVIIEKHYRTPISRGVLDAFYDTLTKAGSPDDVPSCIAASRNYIISIYREKLFLVAIVQAEVPVLLVVDFLHRIFDTFTNYFGACTERKLIHETVTVYQVLEEMLDNGFPLSTELNVLKEMIAPPSWTTALDPVTGKKRVKETLPQGQLSNTQWRRSNVKYTNNEIFVDVTERIHAVIDRTGTTIVADISGKILSKCRLSGVPDLTLSFTNPRILEDVNFHPCVRIQQWSAEKVMSFIPPDGSFELCSYSISQQQQVSLPVYVKPSITYSEGYGRVDIEIGPKQTMGKQVEDVILTMTMPKAVNNMNLTASFGPWSFEQLTKTLKWELKKLPLDKASTLRGSYTLIPGENRVESFGAVSVSFKISNFATSSLKVNRLDHFNVRYKPFKGVKYYTEGTIEARI